MGYYIFNIKLLFLYILILIYNNKIPIKHYYLEFE